MYKLAAAAMCALLLVSCQGSGEQKTTRGDDESRDLYELVLTDRAAFGQRVTAVSTSDADRADAIVLWFAENFDWTATDYKKRTVEEILERKGGNCAELARVATAVLDDLGLRMRQVREINIHVESDRRKQSAADKIAERGNKMSVFGRRHNDHVWIEIQDGATGAWFPADPSLGVVGEQDWLAARLGFGERFSLDPSSEDMIAPFAIFAVDENGDLTVNRTAHYVIQGFDDLYAGNLRGLAAWSEWVRLVQQLDDEAIAAFRGEVNLHEHESAIDSLAMAYESLKEQYANIDR